uniref:C2H2-type domain-containing protein n=1 Tax=Rhizophagus irregularis (strain DAOM 181602 / DAOM 197198 / MUCL 43194) TaxID=747089 RepID=U9UL61_RHIID
MVKTGNSNPNRADICNEATQEWNKVKSKSMAEIDEIIRNFLSTPYNLYNMQIIRPSYTVHTRKDTTTPFPTIRSVDPIQEEIPANASAQKKIANEITVAEKKITEFEQIYNITTDSQVRHDMYTKIENLQAEIESNRKKIVKLKRNATYAQNCRTKKVKMLTESQEVVRYDHPGRPSLLFAHPDLHDRIHDSVEFGSADSKRRKEVVKVQIIDNLRNNLKENYNIYMARTTLNNYLLSRQANSIAAKAHHHPVWVAVAGISHTDTQEHIDGHYCLASVKYVRQFASMFADMSVIISQDDKAKIGLGMPAVGRTFRTLQSINEPVFVADHDFPSGSGQKLIPSDLESLVLDSKYDDALKTNEQIRPIWILLVDGSPDKNPRHLKNIKVYCQLFKKFDLDYLSVRTHAPGQSKYNPVERGMATLSALCNIWSRDSIFGKHVDAQYIDTLKNPFENLQFKSTEKEKAEELKRQQKQNNVQKDDETNEHTFSECFVPLSWIERHCNLCAYSIDIKKCKDSSCCEPSRANDAIEFLETFNGFMPPVTKAKDGYYTNPIHLLQYCDLLKIPGYDAHYPSFKEKYSRLCCSTCQKYFPTINFLMNHRRTAHPTAQKSKEHTDKRNAQNSKAFDDSTLHKE